MMSRCRFVGEMNSSVDRTSSALFWLDPAGPGSNPSLNSLEVASPTSDSSRSFSATGVHSLSSPTVESITSQESDKDSLMHGCGSPSEKDHHYRAQLLQYLRGSVRGRGLDRKRFGAGGAAISHARLSSPDRFLPARESPPAAATPFRLNKNPQLLSPNEKLFRRRDPNTDPFNPSDFVRHVAISRCNGMSDRRYAPHHLPRHVIYTSVAGRQESLSIGGRSRQIRGGAVWTVGGSSASTAGSPVGISDGQGGLLASGTNAPMYLANFLINDTPLQHLQKHESRLALALDIDQAARVLNICDPIHYSLRELRPAPPPHRQLSPFTWKNGTWTRGEAAVSTKRVSKPFDHAVPSTPFRVLDAPLLRDDFYCSTLAYSHTARILAVGLGSRVYLWSEFQGVQYPPLATHQLSNYVTSLSFSSPQGGRSILAVGRRGGQVSLWSTFDPDVRFEVRQPSAVSCVSFKQTTTHRPSERFRGMLVDTEDLAVGDDLGDVWYYSVEWADSKSRESFQWSGIIVLLAKISAHTQQVCGLAWSPDDTYLATGGNDNACLLFDISDIFGENKPLTWASCPKRGARHSAILQHQNVISRLPCYPHLSRIFEWHHRINQITPASAATAALANPTSGLSRIRFALPERARTILIPPNRQKHRLCHSAAVKALAFAPWQPSLLATGGGSNDRCIHFYHAPSGARLATINVHAQVTSLIWSKTRREIAATFGYAVPEHPFRIAVFAWPSCQQVVAIPWGSSSESRGYSVRSGGRRDVCRALWAISYPGAPNSAPRGANPSYRSSSSTARTTPTAISIAETEISPSRAIASESRTWNIFATNSSIASSCMSYKEGGTWWSRTMEEGCIIVASSDECVKFHEVWSGARKSTSGSSGQLGGSDILESLEGIDKEGHEIIR